MFFTARKKIDIRNPQFFDVSGYHGNYQVAKDSDAVIEYIRKHDSNPYEVGIYVGNNQSKVQKLAL